VAEAPTLCRRDATVAARESAGEGRCEADVSARSVAVPLVPSGHGFGTQAGATSSWTAAMPSPSPTPPFRCKSVGRPAAVPFVTPPPSPPRWRPPQPWRCAGGGGLSERYAVRAVWQQAVGVVGPPVAAATGPTLSQTGGVRCATATARKGRGCHSHPAQPPTTGSLWRRRRRRRRWRWRRW